MAEIESGGRSARRSRRNCDNVHGALIGFSKIVSCGNRHWERCISKHRILAFVAGGVQGMQEERSIELETTLSFEEVRARSSLKMKGPAKYHPAG
ncbi:MAG: hypothetical protein ABR572_05005 [Cryomorphaceae bacterium]|nr:hypothetical protein [Flavobacteriales bacterium]